MKFNWNVSVRLAFLYQDIGKYGHADIDKYGDFWLKCVSSLFKWTIIIRIRQNMHYLTAFDIAILNWF